MKKLLYTAWVLTAAFASRAQDRITTIAGSPGNSGFTNGTGLSASFGDPASIVADGSGNFYVADSANNLIRKISTGTLVTTFAGQAGVAGAANGTTSAQFDTPTGLARDSQGNLYVSDTGNNTIRKIDTSGTVSTIAGLAQQSGYQDAAAGSALFNSPLGLAIATNGALYIADGGNHCIRILYNGVVTTFAGSPQHWGAMDGSGTNALFNSPCGITFDAAGNLFVSDANNNAIRKITPAGVVTTYAGQMDSDGYADGSLASARFWSPAELTFDKVGNLFIADSRNQVIRKISTNGMVSTVSGIPHGSGAQDGANGTGRYYNPYSIAIAPDGSLVVTDTYNELVRNVIVPFKLTLKSKNSPGQATLSWDAVTGKTYALQFKTDSASPWANLLPPFTPTSNSIVITDFSAPINSTRFYRVLLLP